MYLPPELDERIRTRFDTLIPEIDQLAKEVDESSSRNASERQNWESDRYRRGSGPMPEPLDETRFQRLHTNALSLLTSVSSNACSKQLRVAIEDIQRMSGAHNGPSLLATCRACTMII